MALTPLALLLAAPLVGLSDGLIDDLIDDLIDGAVIEGARAPGEIKDALRPLAADLAGCVDGAGIDAVVEVEFAAAGAVVGAAVVVSGADDAGRVSAACVLHVLEGVALKDRGSEPPTHALLRFTDRPAPPPLPWPALRRALQRSHAEIGRCVRRLRAAQPGLRGTVLARLRLDDGGRVASVVVEGNDAGLRGCVQGALKAVYIDDAFAGRVVVAPFAFEDADAGVDPRAAAEHKTFFSFIGCDLPIP